MQTEFAFHGGVRDMALVAGYLLPTHWHFAMHCFQTEPQVHLGA